MCCLRYCASTRYRTALSGLHERGKNGGDENTHMSKVRRLRELQSGTKPCKLFSFISSMRPTTRENYLECALSCGVGKGVIGRHYVFHGEAMSDESFRLQLARAHDL